MVEEVLIISKESMEQTQQQLGILLSSTSISARTIRSLPGQGPRAMKPQSRLEPAWRWFDRAKSHSYPALRETLIIIFSIPRERALL